MKRIVLVVGIVVAAIAVAGIRVVREGRAALAEGDDAAVRNRPSEAIAAWETAARWYLPYASHVDDAYSRLEGMRKDHDQVRALLAARAERRAALATRHLTDPHDPSAANAAIATLASADPEGALAAGTTREARAAWHAERLARDPRPAAGPSALAVLGIIAWLVGIGLVVQRGSFAGRPGIVAGAIAVVGLAAWAAGLYNA